VLIRTIDGLLHSFTTPPKLILDGASIDGWSSLQRIVASVDLVARLIDTAIFRGLCSIPSNRLTEALSNGELRVKRPEEIQTLERVFDIDAEGDFLDWFEKQSIVWTNSGFLNDLCKSNITLADASEGLRLLSEFASPGSFRCWEGRMMLYLDVLLNRKIEDIDDLYSDKTWLEASNLVECVDIETYTESVVMQWIRTREDLGETMDPKQDPRILPTMEAHQTSSDRLHRTLQSANLPELHLMVGRDWTEATSWGQGKWNLGYILENGLPEA